MVGAGTVGLAVAWTLARSGRSVAVYDPEPGSGASWVAGGMIAPYSEAWPGEEALVRLGAASLRLWSAFAAALRPHADGEPITARGTVWLALDACDTDELRTMAETVRAAGYPAEQFRTESAAAARARIPGAVPRARGGAWVPGEIAVDNRIVFAALLAACRAEGVSMVRERVADVDAVAARRVVVCTGADAGELVPDAGVYPVKGEIVRLRCGPTCLPPPTVTVRAKVGGRQVYIVPRADGVVVGATQYENDRNLAPRVGPVVELLGDAFAVLPYLRDYELVEVRAGLRPSTRDNLPVIAERGPRVLIAAGHGRNGILLTPVTAARVAGLVTGRAIEDGAEDGAIEGGAGEGAENADKDGDGWWS